MKDYTEAVHPSDMRQFFSRCSYDSSHTEKRRCFLHVLRGMLPLSATAVPLQFVFLYFCVFLCVFV